MSSRWTVVLGAVLVIVLAAVGCGGGGSSSVDTTLTVSSLAKPQFVKKANDICYGAKTTMSNELQKYFKEHPNLPRGNPGTEAIDDILLPSVETQLAELRELGAPAGEVRQIEAMWSGLERSAKLIEEQGFSASPAIRHAFLPNGQRILAYGMPGCAYGR